VARLLAPENAPIESVARDVGVGVHTLERWREEVLAEPSRERAWTASARLEAVIATAALDETARGAWCRQNAVFPQTLQEWRDSAMKALADPSQARAAGKHEREDRQRIQQLERELLRKDKALAETAALLVLSKKAEAIFNKGGDE
jgi:transposase